MVHGNDYKLFHSLLTGDALGAVVVSIGTGVAALALVYRRRFEAARYAAAVAVAAIIVGWALARWPTILPGLSVDQAAAGHDTLVWVVVAVLGGGAILFPSLGLLFRLQLAGRFRPAETGAAERAGEGLPAHEPRLLVRFAIACLIAGIGLLNVADARWAHTVGILCLFAFIVSAFLAIIPAALGEEAVPARRSNSR